MGVILDIVAPVFIIIGLGYVAATRGFIDEAGFRGLTGFIFNLAIPALLFVGGIMNVTWIAAIAVLVLIEKVTPAGRAIGRVGGLALLAAGVWLFVGQVM